MSACFGVCHGHIAYAVDGEAVVQTTVVAQNTAMAVGGVLAEADVGDNEKRGEAGAEETDGLNDRTLRVVGCSTESILHVRGNGDTEENYGAEAFPYEGFEVRDEFVDAAAVLVGKGGYKSFFFSLVRYEKGVDEH